jgi:hypothetical protein
VKTAEVRTDSGKFVSSAWSRSIQGRSWWVVIGLENTIVTVIETDKNGLGDDIIREGLLYEYVRGVNRTLMNGAAS